MKKIIILFSLILFLGCIDTPKSDIYYFKDINQSGGIDMNKVAVSATDTTAGFLVSKLAAGSNITLTTLNPGANEQIQISSSGGGGDSNASLDTRYVQKNPTATQTISSFGLAIPFDTNIYNANSKLEIKQRITAGAQYYASLEENQTGLGIGVQHGLSVLTSDNTETPVVIYGNNNLNEGIEFDYDYGVGTIQQSFLSTMSNPRFNWVMPHTIDFNSVNALQVNNETATRVFNVDTNSKTIYAKKLNVDDLNASCLDLNDACITKTTGDGNYVQKFPTGNQTIASNNLILTSGHYETTTGGFRYGGDTGYGMDFPIPANCTFAFSVQGLPNSGTAFCTGDGAIEQRTLDDRGHADFMLSTAFGSEWHKPQPSTYTPASPFKGAVSMWIDAPDGNHQYCYQGVGNGWKECGTYQSAFGSPFHLQRGDVNGTLDVNGNADFNKSVNVDLNLTVQIDILGRNSLYVDKNLDLNAGRSVLYYNNTEITPNKRDANALIWSVQRDANTGIQFNLTDTANVDRNSIWARYDGSNKLVFQLHDLAASAASLPSLTWNPADGQVFQRVSDPSVKHNITPIDVNELKLAELTEYSWIDNYTGLAGYGYLSTEVCQKIPQACQDNGNGLHGVDYELLSILAIRDLKNRRAKEAILQAQNDIMKSFICNQPLNPAAVQACNQLNQLSLPLP